MIFTHFESSPILATWSAHLNLLDLITLIILEERYKPWSYSLWGLLYSPFSSLLGSKICLRILISDIFIFVIVHPIIILSWCEIYRYIGKMAYKLKFWGRKIIAICCFNSKLIEPTPKCEISNSNFRLHNNNNNNNNNNKIIFCIV